MLLRTIRLWQVPSTVLGEADVIINVGVSGPGVVKRALEKVRGQSFDVVAETVKKTAFKITRIGQLVGQMASERLGVEFGIVDLSLAPLLRLETLWHVSSKKWD